ncbi:MAG: hypothetical protein JWS10_3119 [Cypionkella sp.]|nr:hypothetical protein [Cypionkella sp.]
MRLVWPLLATRLGFALDLCAQTALADPAGCEHKAACREITTMGCNHFLANQGYALKERVFAFFFCGEFCGHRSAFCEQGSRFEHRVGEFDQSDRAIGSGEGKEAAILRPNHCGDPGSGILA